MSVAENSKSGQRSCDKKRERTMSDSSLPFALFEISKNQSVSKVVSLAEYTKAIMPQFSCGSLFFQSSLSFWCQVHVHAFEKQLSRGDLLRLLNLAASSSDRRSSLCYWHTWYLDWASNWFSHGCCIGIPQLGWHYPPHSYAYCLTLVWYPVLSHSRKTGKSRVIVAQGFPFQPHQVL